MHRLVRGWKGREERVALSSNLGAAGPRNGRFQDLGVLVLDRAVVLSELLEEAGRSLYVGEEESDGSGREFNRGRDARRRGPSHIRFSTCLAPTGAPSSRERAPQALVEPNEAADRGGAAERRSGPVQAPSTRGRSRRALSVVQREGGILGCRSQSGGKPDDRAGPCRLGLECESALVLSDHAPND